MFVSSNLCKCLCFRHSHRKTHWFIVSFSYAAWIWNFLGMKIWQLHPCWPCKRGMLRQAKRSTNDDTLETTWSWCLSSKNDKIQHISLFQHGEIPIILQHVVSLHFLKMIIIQLCPAIQRETCVRSETHKSPSNPVKSVFSYPWFCCVFVQF